MMTMPSKFRPSNSLPADERYTASSTANVVWKPLHMVMYLQHQFCSTIRRCPCQVRGLTVLSLLDRMCMERTSHNKLSTRRNTHHSLNQPPTLQAG